MEFRGSGWKWQSRMKENLVFDISSSKITAVPYAFHAGTANALSGSKNNMG
jgi:hypothetical protein